MIFNRRNEFGKDEKIGWILFSLLAAIPCFYVIFVSQTIFFSNFASSMNSLGRLTSLAGTVLFASVFVLSTRLKVIEDLFNGLDKAYKAHHFFGAASFLLLLFHPLFLASQFAANSLAQAAGFLIPANNVSINAGIFAILLMQLFLLFTFFIKLQYKRWRLSHQFLGLSFLFASIHIFTISSDISRDLFLKIYMFIFVLIGIISYAYRTLFWKWLVKRNEFEITHVKKLNENVAELKLFCTNHFKFRAGQFVFVSFLDKSIGKEVHPFSISSSPSEEILGLTIKSLGDFTSKVSQIEKGTKVLIEGPYGRFYLDEHKNSVFVAGGIGITPFLSMARNISNHSEKKITLFWSVNDEKEAIFAKELFEIAQKNKNFKFVLFPKDKRGYINANFIIDESNYSSQEIFLCAPPAMMLSLKKQLLSAGIKKSKIHMEEFSII